MQKLRLKELAVDETDPEIRKSHTQPAEGSNNCDKNATPSQKAGDASLRIFL
jgi:hypothetical protein